MAIKIETPIRAETSVSGATLQALQQENQRLKRAVEELSFLNELARAIGLAKALGLQEEAARLQAEFDSEGQRPAPAK